MRTNGSSPCSSLSLRVTSRGPVARRRGRRRRGRCQSACWTAFLWPSLRRFREVSKDPGGEAKRARSPLDFAPGSGKLGPDERERLRRHRDRRRLAGRALRGRLGRRRPARGRRGARAGGRGVHELGMHPVQDAAAPGRGGPWGARGGRQRRRRRRGGAGLARLHGLGPQRRGSGALAGRQRHRPAARHRAAGRSGRGRGRRRAPHRRPRGPATAPIRSCRRSRACASSRASGPTAR